MKEDILLPFSEVFKGKSEANAPSLQSGFSVRVVYVHMCQRRGNQQGTHRFAMGTQHVRGIHDTADASRATDTGDKMIKVVLHAAQRLFGTPQPCRDAWRNRDERSFGVWKGRILPAAG